jgi:predicted permease
VVMELPLDWRVLGFAIAAAMVTSLLFGLAPALRATRLDLSAEFQGGTRALGPGRSRLSQSLMVVQIALSLVLLISTGLFVRTLRNLQNVDSGFNHHRLVHFRIDALGAGYTRANFDTLNHRVQEQIERIPGVRAVTFARVPFLARGRWTSNVSIPGFTPPPGTSMQANTNGVAPNFFQTIELPLVLGRAFTERDDAAAPKVAIVNQAFVDKFLAGESPLGRRFLFNRTDTELVGVLRDAKYNDLRAAIVPTVYVPAAQSPGGQANFAVRGSGEPELLFNSIRAAVREIDPTIPVAQMRTQEQQLAINHAQELLFARFSGLFGALALGLSCVGLYGLMSYQVVRRTGEIGLRIALGALPGHVMGMIFKESLALVCTGIVLGLAGAWAASRLVASMLFGLSPTDPFTYALVAGILIAVALLAALFPARRAAKIDPMVALRTE